MASLCLIFWVVFYCILGAYVIVCPDKTKYKLSQASTSTIRWWGIIIFGAGVWLAIAVILFNSSLALTKSLFE